MAFGMMECPRCAEHIKSRATVCRFCGQEFSSPEQSEPSTVGEWAKVGCLLWVVIIMGWLLYSLVVGRSDTERAKDAKERVAGFHCVGGMDGSSFRFINAVKAQLRDPASFEHVETGIRHEEDGKHYILMTFRSRNGFGGMNVSSARGYVDHATCEVVGDVSISAD